MLSLPSRKRYSRFGTFRDFKVLFGGLAKTAQGCWERGAFGPPSFLL